jgi:hypothetical protein
MSSTREKLSPVATTTFEFSLILGGADEVSTEIENALHAAGCDDALLGSRDGVLFLDFDRVSTSLMEAVLSAVENVRDADVGLWVERVEPDDLVTASEIARRVDRSRESIRQLVHGERGPGGFPAPVANLTKTSPIWRWSDVAVWFDEKLSAVLPALVADAADLAALNAALELQRTLTDVSAVNRLWGSGAVPPGAGIRLELKTRRKRVR